MPARSFASSSAILLGFLALATPAGAETYVVTPLVQSVDVIDPSVLEYGQTYPIPSPAYSVIPGYPHASWRQSWLLRRSPSPVVLYAHPCAVRYGWRFETSSPCGVVIGPPVYPVVEAPLVPPGHRSHRHARLQRSCRCERAHTADSSTDASKE